MLTFYSMSVNNIIKFSFRSPPVKQIIVCFLNSRRTDRPCSGYLPDCLPNGQHGSHSFYHSLLAYVPRLLLHRLFHRLETLRNPRLGLVHGFRYPCHSVFPFNIMATRHRSTLRSLHDFFYFPHHRTFPCHAFI